MSESILVVESHADLRIEILEMLRREHYECEGVSTGDAALLKIREQDYRYIVVDVDGATAAASLFQSCLANGTLGKLVLLTDFDETNELPEGASNCAMLRKPFDSHELLKRLTR